MRHLQHGIVRLKRAHGERSPAAALASSPCIGYPPRVTWNDNFLELFDRCVSRYRSGDSDFEGYYTDSDLEFLGEIGCRTREFFDFVEDFCEDNAPSPTTALLVAAVRRDYFLSAQEEVPCSGPLLTRDDVPTFGEDLAGMPYLPRILAKARAKLRGTLDPDLMFGCGGDRNFLRKHGNLHPADFLRNVWAAGDDDQKVATWVASSIERAKL